MDGGKCGVELPITFLSTCTNRTDPWEGVIDEFHLKLVEAAGHSGDHRIEIPVGQRSSDRG